MTNVFAGLELKTRDHLQNAVIVFIAKEFQWDTHNKPIPFHEYDVNIWDTRRKKKHHRVYPTFIPPTLRVRTLSDVLALAYQMDADYICIEAPENPSCDEDNNLRWNTDDISLVKQCAINVIVSSEAIAFQNKGNVERFKPRATAGRLKKPTTVL